VIPFGDYSMGDRGSSNGDDPVPERQGGLDAQLDRIVPSEAPAAFLMVVAGDQPGRVHPLAKNTVIIGRAPTADIRVSDRSVSNEHARIINGSTGFEIEDLSSTNGTFLGARKVMRSRLKNGDRVRIGSVEFAFLVDRESDATIALISAAAVQPLRRETIPLPALRAMPDDEEGLSLEDLVHKGVHAYEFLRRYALVIGFLLGAGGTLGFASAYVLPAAPVAFCQVKLLPAPKMNPLGGSDQYRPPSETGDTLQFFDAAETAFTNPDLIRESLKKLGDPNPNMESVISVASRLSLATDGNRLYKATYKETMFGNARRSPVEFLTVHMRQYLELEIGKMLRLYTSQATFFKAKADKLDKEFNEVQKQMVQFQTANSDALPGQEPTTYSSRASLEAHRADITAQLLRVQAELENARKNITSGRPLAPWRETSAQAYRQQLAVVQAKIADAQARGYGDQHPDMIALLKERDNVNNLITEQLRSPATALEKGASGSYAAAESSFEALQAQERGLRAQAGQIDRDLARVKKVMSDLPRVSGQLADLARKRDSIKHQYEVALQEQQKAELQLNLEKELAQGRYEIVEKPQLEPIKRKKVLLLRTGIGLGIGVFLTVIFILMREARRIINESMRPGSRRRGYARS
jgi:hypothetical protein